MILLGKICLYQYYFWQVYLNLLLLLLLLLTVFCLVLFVCLFPLFFFFFFLFLLSFQFEYGLEQSLFLTEHTDGKPDAQDQLQTPYTLLLNGIERGRAVNEVKKEKD